jgi:phosphate uptake regulator
MIRGNWLPPATRLLERVGDRAATIVARFTTSHTNDTFVQ